MKHFSRSGTPPPPLFSTNFPRPPKFTSCASQPSHSPSSKATPTQPTHTKPAAVKLPGIWRGFFEAIVRRHGPMVWGVCRRVLRDHHDVQDAFQSTFLVLARKAASIAHREKLGNCLYGVAFHTAMKARTTRARRRAREVQVPDMPEPAAESDGRLGNLAEPLDRELSCLPEKYRIPVVLCDLEGMTRVQAASQLGWPVGTVSSRLSKGRAMLASRLARHGTTLATGALAVLLARESASASMPTKLIGPTARAASLVAAGDVMSAGLVPAGVAALTREVMKSMLQSRSPTIPSRARAAIGASTRAGAISCSAMGPSAS